jgi:hypothetical protein
MPTVKQVEQSLNYIAANPNDEKSKAGMQKLGLDETYVGAWRAANALDDADPRKAEAKNKIFDRVATALPPKEEAGGVGFIDRFAVQNLIDRDPQLQVKYLEKKGYQARVVGDRVEAKKPGETQYNAVDPKGFDRFDIFDVFGDALEALATGVATGAKAMGAIGAPTTGGFSLPAASAVGAAATGGFEFAKQTVAKAVGAREEYDPGRITQAAMIGGTIPVLAKGGGKLLELGGQAIKKAGSWLAPLKANADDVAKAAKEIGAEVTPGMVTDSALVGKLESSLVQSSGKAGGIVLRSTVKKNQKALQETAENIVDDAATASSYEIGAQAGQKLIETVKKRLAPAEAIYDKMETLFSRSAYKPDISRFDDFIDDLADNFKFSDDVLSKLGNIKSKLPEVKNLTDLKTLRTNIREQMQASSDPGIRRAFSQLYDEATKLRGQVLLDLSEKRGGQFFMQAKQEIEQADKIYAAVSNDVKNAIMKRGARQLRGGPLAAVKEFVEKVPEGKLIQNVLQTNDPRKIAAVEKAFPEAFELMRQGKISEIVAKSQLKGAVSPTKLAKQIDAMPPEARKLIFGEQASQKAASLKTFLDNIGERLGPSGTPEGVEFYGLFNVVKHATSLGREALMRSLTSEAMEKGILTQAGKFVAAPAFVGAAEFGARQALPAPQNNGGFQLPRR